jgi:hypothetical protein
MTGFFFSYCAAALADLYLLVGMAMLAMCCAEVR